MRDYLQLRKAYLRQSIESEAPSPTCLKCNSSNPVWRCLQCFGRPMFCRDCCRDAHWLNPFHRIEEWKGSFFSPAWLADVGLSINLGHQGNPCPANLRKGRNDHNDEDNEDLEENSRHDDDSSWGWGKERRRRDEEGNPVMTIVDITGFHPIGVKQCRCPNSGLKHTQLFKAQLYPATSSKPKTCFTFSVLDDFRLTNLECKTATNNFHTLLQRRTSNPFSKDVPVGFT